MAKRILKMPQSSDSNTMKSTRFSNPIGSSLQESQALLSSLHHSTPHFSRNQVNQLNGRHFFVSVKQGSAQWALLCTAYYVCMSLMTISAANPARVRLKADFCVTRMTIKFSQLQNAPDLWTESSLQLMLSQLWPRHLFQLGKPVVNTESMWTIWPKSWLLNLHSYNPLWSQHPSK